MDGRGEGGDEGKAGMLEKRESEGQDQKGEKVVIKMSPCTSMEKVRKTEREIFPIPSV